jgi:hypothetical protein
MGRIVVHGHYRESSQDPISTNKKLPIVMFTHHPSYVGSMNRRSMVQTRPGIH